MKRIPVVSNIPATTKRLANLLFAVIVMAGFFLLGDFYHGKKGETMYKEKTGAVNKAIPPIDAAVPGKTETATFALG